MINRTHGIDAKYIRNRITQLREQKGVTEYKMGLDLGKSRSYIQNIRNCKALPSMAEFLIICDYFGITPQQFFDTDIPNPVKINQAIEKMRMLNNNGLDSILNILDLFIDNQGTQS